MKGMIDYTYETRKIKLSCSCINPNKYEFRIWFRSSELYYESVSLELIWNTENYLSQFGLPCSMKKGCHIVINIELCIIIFVFSLVDA